MDCSDKQPRRTAGPRPERPEGYLPITSALGHGAPRELLIAPATADGTVHAMVELGFLRALHAEDIELLNRVSESLGVAIRSSKDRTRRRVGWRKPSGQGEEFATQQEELPCQATRSWRSSPAH